MMTVFLAMIAGHCLADYPLQTDFIAMGKNRHTPKPVPWYYLMGAHSILHGAMVGIATGVAGLGVAEAIAHYLIDCAKCEGWTDIHVDQALHVACKAIWVACLLSV